MTVHLVGAGPGDPDLLTVRAAELLRRADVVVHDRLVDARVLGLAPPWAEMVDVGKRPGDPADRQEQINEILVDRGRRFDCVVRLKGGDPYVFGRGGEEALALRAGGVEVDEVPGITSAIAAPAAAGIPVTMRGVSSGFTVVTAHQDPATDRWLDWDALARSRTTLVVLMGVIPNVFLRPMEPSIGRLLDRVHAAVPVSIQVELEAGDAVEVTAPELVDADR